MLLLRRCKRQKGQVTMDARSQLGKAVVQCNQAVIYISENNDEIPPSHVTPDTQARRHPGRDAGMQGPRAVGFLSGVRFFSPTDPVSPMSLMSEGGGTGDVPMPLSGPHCEGAADEETKSGPPGSALRHRHHRMAIGDMG
jgi:hypothetical protein